MVSVACTLPPVSCPTIQQHVSSCRRRRCGRATQHVSQKWCWRVRVWNLDSLLSFDEWTSLRKLLTWTWWDASCRHVSIVRTIWTHLLWYDLILQSIFVQKWQHMCSLHSFSLNLMNICWIFFFKLHLQKRGAPVWSLSIVCEADHFSERCRLTGENGGKETWEKWLQSGVNLWTLQHESRGWRRPMNNQAESEESSRLMVCLQMRPLPRLTFTRQTELTVISRFVTDWPLRSSLMFPRGKISIYPDTIFFRLD